MFSDHCPITFTFEVKLPKININTQNAQDSRGFSKSVKWNIEHVQILNVELQEIVNMSLNTQGDVNTCVHHFCDVVNSIVLPHCIVKEGCVHGGNNDTKPSRIFKEDKPWLNESCKANFLEYKKALHDFNINKSVENHGILIVKNGLIRYLKVN